MISSQRFEIAHLDLMQPKDIYENDSGFRERIEGLIKPVGAIAISFFDDGIPISVIGLIPCSPGVMEAWAVTTDLVKKHPITFHKKVLNALHFFVAKLKIHRVQMSVRSDYEGGRKWATALGFEFEGTLKNSGPAKNDYDMFAKIFKENI